MLARTPVSTGPSTQQFAWQPGLLTWTSRDAAGNLIGTATASGADVPVPYDEVVLSGFTFTPYPG